MDSLFSNMAKQAERFNKYSKLYNAMLAERRELPEPKKPSVFVSEIDYNAYLDKFYEYGVEMERLKLKIQEAFDQLKTVERELWDTIPMENTWFKVNEWAVGKYRDSYSKERGVVVRPWSDNIAEIKFK